MVINRVIDTYTKNFITYHYEDWYWVINPDTMEWVVNVSDSGYTFFNRDYWKNFFRFCPSEDTINDISNWVVDKLKTPSSKHCHPDYIPNDYDWRNEFGGQRIIDVINKGKLVYGKGI